MSEICSGRNTMFITYHVDGTTCFRGTFARNTVLRVLHMNHNRLRRLDSNSFRGMRFIRRLYFSDNQITDVGRGTFGSVTRVGTVDFARNFIKKIDFQMFYQLQYVEVIFSLIIFISLIVAVSTYSAISSVMLELIGMVLQSILSVAGD